MKPTNELEWSTEDASDFARSETRALEDKLKEAVKVIEYYAEKGHWVCPDCLSHAPHQHHPQRFWIKTTNGHELAADFLARLGAGGGEG